MSIVDKIKIIPIELPFLKILARYSLDKFKEFSPDFHNILLIFPSQRNKFYFRRYLLEESGNKGIIPPEMKTIEELMEYVYELLGGKRGMLLDKIERNFILKDVVDSLKIEFWQDLPFLKFISIGDRLLNFFDELSKERVSLEYIEEKTKLGHYPEKYIENELPLIGKIYKEYKKRIIEQNYQDEIDKYDLIYSQFNSKLLKEYKYIFLAGLGAPTNVENKIIKDILENLPAELILHSAKNGIMEMSDTDKPFYIHYKLLSSLGIDKDTRIEIIDGKVLPPAVFHIKSTETESQQTFYLRKIMEDLKNHYEFHRIGIILSDETIVYSITETLKAIGLEFNLSMGFSFTQSILYSFLNQLKEVVESNYHYQEFFAFIKHPLFKNAKIESQNLRPMVYQLQNFMIKNRLNYFDPNEHQQEIFLPLIKLLKDCFDTIQVKLSFNEYVNEMIKLLNNLLLYNQELISTNSPEIEKFLERLNVLSKLRIPKEALQEGIKMLEFILHILKYETYNLMGDPMKGVQIIGLLEARNLDFDCIILPSMNEGIFPRGSEKDLFVNQQVRREVHLPHDKERENLYYYYFTEMINGKKEVFISYVTEEKRDIRSRFIDFLVEDGVVVDESKIQLDRVSIDISKRGVKKDQKLLRWLSQKLQNQGLSPTHLKDYKQCPYRFYLKYICSIKEPKEIIEEPGPKEWGSIIHIALKNFYKYDFPDGLTDKDSEEKARISLYKRLDDAIKQVLAKKPKNITFLDLEIYKKRLDKFLSLEIERFQSGFKIDISKLEKKLDYTVTVNNNKIILGGNTDRIDIFNNKYYIIDYKSTAPTKKEYQIGADFMEFQLPLYALISSGEDFEKIGGMTYYVIEKEIKIIEIVKDDNLSQFLKDFKEQILLPTIQEIINPRISFYSTEIQDNCKYCNYINLCGVKNVKKY